jgi:hypothetical protein
LFGEVRTFCSRLGFGGLKRALSVALAAKRGLWQPGFFDHVLRSDESYSEKWNYVRDNPVRAKLIERADDCHIKVRLS